MVTVIANKAEFDAAIAQDKLVVLDMHATWCGPCKQVAPKIEALSKEETNVAFYKIDVDEVPDVASELGVRAMPTFYFYREGVKVAEVVGANIRAVTAAVADHKG
ncbi:thioredoxin TrxA [Pyronema domesticum]|uniref:Thioredoxin n=1 Tax=Pyronema omphalodes (strain CBS 100304) TaxID=1076935 RepID=U4LB97_PYROM|nr:thioredoxin TrxA [Pyronema domesticum]CCX16790.1 Similar to Thioredoxin-1; acc. no. P22217 [Pyronema omphalodes CBS 100304]